MSTETERKEDKAMSTISKTRRAHDLLDELDARAELSQEQEKLLRSFLPELPKQKTLEELAHDVYDVWIASNGDEWGSDGDGSGISLENWLYELHKQLRGLKDAPAHPVFLETEADYQNAPEGTIVACEDSPPWHKFDSTWLSTITHGRNDAKRMTGIIRCVLRWGWGE